MRPLLLSTLAVVALSPWLTGADQPTTTIPVDAPAFVFSPGNWTGDAGRGGARYRQSWNPGAYCRVSWTSAGSPAATLRLDTGIFPAGVKPLKISYAVDGVWKTDVVAAPEITLAGFAEGPRHDLTVILQMSEQKNRWAKAEAGGGNVLRITGLQVPADSVAVPAAPATGWALIVGDSITEGCGAGALAPYAHLLGQALRTRGWEYGISACGWSGWLNKGDNPPGDVPGYYVVRGGTYDDAASRWNKLDGDGHSLLDSAGRISAYGGTGQEPSLILINYGTNDALHKSDPGDTRASIQQALVALRRAAPAARIVILIPFGQFYAQELKDAVAQRLRADPTEKNLAIVDLGEPARNVLKANGAFGGLHPNDRGHANFAAQLIPQVLALLPPGK